MKQFLVENFDNKDACALWGNYFEKMGHLELSGACKTYEVDLLSSSQESKRSSPLTNLTFPSLIPHKFTNMSDLSSLDENQYAVPSSNFASVDSVWYNKTANLVRMFQFSKSAIHGYKAKGLVDIMNKFENNTRFELYLVVPGQVYKETILQKYIHNQTIPHNLNETITQYKLKMDASHFF
jgi:hypothetical protein